MPTWLAQLVFVNLLVFAPVCAIVAKQRGRSVGEGAIVGAVLGILGLLLIAIAPAGQPGTRVCPNCAERVQAAAKVCRYCSTVLTPVEVPTGGPSLSGTSWVLLGLIGAGLVMVVVMLR